MGPPGCIHSLYWIIGTMGRRRVRHINSYSGYQLILNFIGLSQELLLKKVHNSQYSDAKSHTVSLRDIISKT